MSEPDYRSGLEALARLHGIETSYRSAGGVEREASDESLLRILASMGTPVEGASEITEAARRLRARRAERRLPRMQVVWEGERRTARIRLPLSGSSHDRIECRMAEECGREHEWRVQLADLEVIQVPDPEGGSESFALIPLPEMGWGVHDLDVTLPGPGSVREGGRIIHAPATVYGGRSEGAPREWGFFLPLHALRTEDDWGVGDLTGLGRMCRWAREMGAGTVATLPILATYLDDPFEPSPYSPVSRLFWNELYLDPTSAPEFSKCVEAQEFLASRAFLRERDELRSRDQVDYERAHALKRRVLEMLARTAFENGTGAAGPLGFARRTPDLVGYARFRSSFERHGHRWWKRTRGMSPPARSLGGPLDEAGRYHVYVQWLLSRELGGHTDPGVRTGPSPDAAELYLDLPLGCHPLGFDSWRWPELFAEGAAVGAPPDAMVQDGQNWGFPPLRPEASRLEGHRYWRESLRTLLAPSAALRIDHVMALHRLFWIPDGMSPAEGVYVRNRAEELYAILAIESRRNECIVVGEDLGTVPGGVRDSMERRGLLRMHVLPFETSGDAGVGTVPANAQASLNTHDMATFSGFVSESDLDRHEAEGTLGDEDLARERKKRRTHLAALRVRLERDGLMPPAEMEETRRLLLGCLRLLAASPARLLLVNLEDLWLESRPQNIPGTGVEGGSWTRRARYDLAEVIEMPEVTETLAELHRLRSPTDP